MTMKNLPSAIAAYVPCCEQESADKAAMLDFLARNPDALLRSNLAGHFTASAWIVNPARTHVLMAWHNIYRTWAWTGGHADGNSDLLAVALREAGEETGAACIEPVSRDIYSLEILPVNPHVKRGRFVSAHLHLNVTFLLQGDEAEPLRAKTDENRAVRWFSPEAFIAACAEPWMNERVYLKLIDKYRRRGRAPEQ